MVIAELDVRAHCLQSTFETHFPGFQVIPRTREVRVPAIVRDFEKRTIDENHLQRLLKSGENPTQIVNENPTRLEMTIRQVRNVLDYIDGYPLADSLESHGERARRRQLLGDELYFSYKRHNQLSVNNITNVVNAFEFLLENVHDSRVAGDMEVARAEIFSLVEGRTRYAHMSLQQKLVVIQRIIDHALFGLASLSEGLPESSSIISIT